MSDAEYNLFLLSYKLILNTLPYAATLKLSILNKYCRVTFIRHTKRITIRDSIYCRDGDLTAFFKSLNPSTITIIYDNDPNVWYGTHLANTFLPIIPSSCETLILEYGGRDINWDLLNKNNSIKSVHFNRIQYWHMRGFRITGDSINNIAFNLPSLTHLTLCSDFNSSIDALSNLMHLTHLTLGKGFDIDLPKLPLSLEKLKFGYFFNRNIDSIHKLTNLTHLTLGDSFDRSIDLLPPSLRKLKIGNNDENGENWFNKPIASLPKSLTKLILGYSIDQPLNFLKDNIHLTHLELGTCFNQEISHLKMNTNLTTLILGNEFNKRLDHLPSNLSKLILGDRFNQCIDNLPPSLLHLTLGNDFSLEVKKWPPNLSYLKIGSSFNRFFDNPPRIRTLKHLILGLYFPINFTYSYGEYFPDLTNLTFSYHFNQLINDLQGIHALSCKIDSGGQPESGLALTGSPSSNLPPKLTHLTLRNKFNKELPVLPSTLQSLILGYEFNQPITSLAKCPNLKRVVLGYDFNQDLTLPESLTDLTLGFAFDKCLNLPLGLTHLTFSHRLNHRLNHDLEKLSDKAPDLRHLTFTQINHQIRSFPSKITNLTLGETFNQPIEMKSPLANSFDASILPPFLTHLTVTPDYRLNLDILKSKLVVRVVSNQFFYDN